MRLLCAIVLAAALIGATSVRGASRVSPGANSEIAYSVERLIPENTSVESDLEICAVDPQTGKTRRLISSLAYEDTDPSWSPGGSRVAFTRDVHGAEGQSASVWIATGRGTGLRSVTGQPASYEDPPTGSDAAWSPDGSTLAYSYTYLQQLYLIGADGKNRRLLRQGGLGLDVGGSDWSPDGRTIAFVDSFLIGQRSIHTIAPDGSGERLLIRDGGHPSWSPDGKRLALTMPVRIPVGTGSEVFVANADGRELTQLTHRSGSDYTPSWSSDGLQIAFVGASGRQTDIYVINTDGTGLRNLTKSPISEHSPDWGSTSALVPPRGRPCALIGSSHRDRIRGSVRDDIITGGRGADLIQAGAGVDSVDGGEGADLISGGAGADVLEGGPEADVLRGGPGIDFLFGDGGPDRLLTRDGRRDRIYCGQGRDRVEADKKDLVHSDCERVDRR